MIYKYFPNGLLIGERKEKITSIKKVSFPVEPNRVSMNKQEIICLIVAIACLISWVIMLF